MSTSLAQRVVARTMLGNILLTIMKLWAGILAGSAALVAEAIHSTGDIVASFTVLVSFRLSKQAVNERHHLEYQKIESICTCLVGMLLIIIGYEFIVATLSNLRTGNLGAPSIAALYVTIICIALKEGMYRYSQNAASKVGGQLLFDDARHHRADIKVLTGVLIGLGAARLGYPVLDGLVTLGISVMILRLGFSFCRNGLGDLVDAIPDKNTLQIIRETVGALAGVESIHELRARQQGSELHLDIHIIVDDKLPVSEGHDVAKDVKTTIMREFPEVSHVMIHVKQYVQRLENRTNG